MARKPNYKFDRLERERKKAAKKAAKLEAKRDLMGDADDVLGEPPVDGEEPSLGELTDGDSAGVRADE